jgi:hypothetical protein
MTQYIDSLTEDLIGSTNLHLACKRIGFESSASKWEIVKHLTVSLATHGIIKMKPETLGRIIGDISPDEIMPAKGELETLSHCSVPVGTDNLRWVAAALLAVIICDRLDPTNPNKNLKPSKFAGRIE